MSDAGLRVSQPGYDVKTCTDKQCIYTSKHGSIKVRLLGSIALTAGVWGEVTHDFGYHPNYFCFVDDADSEN